MTTRKSAAGIAASAALLALAAGSITTPTFAAEPTVHCYGVNSCKGSSDCKTTKNECKGQNTCKGHGFKSMTEKECTAAGGTLTEK